MPIGIVALSYAKRAEEPNPVNRALAKVTTELTGRLRQTTHDTPVVVAQWEISRALPYLHVTVTQADATNVDRGGKPYLDSQDVLNRAFEVFRACGVTEVMVVANPFLHLQAVEAMVRKAGFTVVKHKMPWVGFDNSPLNLQWWCRGPIRFVTYLGIQAIGKVIGKNFHGIGEKPHPH